MSADHELDRVSETRWGRPETIRSIQRLEHLLVKGFVGACEAQVA